MDFVSRRRFLNGTLLAGASLPAAAWLERTAMAAQGPSGRPRLSVDSERTVSTLDRNLFGSFIEHLGRAVYGGIYEPDSRFAGPNGFRKDVLEVIQKLGVPIIRYPGGNFVSGYHWLDGVGPKKDRPRVLDKAWNSIDTNQFGTNEFITWCRAAGVEPLFGTNLGTGTPEMSAALVEYCNVDQGTKWSELRRSHGYEKPHNVKYWCLGNEMDGPWQIGHMPATEYGIKARDTAHQMRMVDPSLTLFACGSSTPTLPTYLEWDRQTLEQCYDLIDGISLHRYFGNGEETGGNTSKYLAMNLSMDLQIEEMIAVCDMVRGHKRSRKTLSLSFDEWNVWYRARGPKYSDGKRQVAPHLLEEVYNLEDALLVGGLINTLIRRSDRVRVACLAQLVNVIAPIMTNEDGLYLQTIYYPYSWALQYARGKALDLAPESPVYSVPGMGDVPYLDVAGTLDSEKKAATLFILNRDLEKSRDLDVVWSHVTPNRVISCQVLTGTDLKAVNSFDAPKHVIPQPLEPPAAGSHMTMELPPRSYTVLSVAIS
ncbi:MAG: alpha-N-arabinofuranosidase [Terriglobia bacterium]